jgi:hypothetical protein
MVEKPARSFSRYTIQPPKLSTGPTEQPINVVEMGRKCVEWMGLAEVSTRASLVPCRRSGCGGGSASWGEENAPSGGC